MEKAKAIAKFSTNSILKNKFNKDNLKNKHVRETLQSNKNHVRETL